MDDFLTAIAPLLEAGNDAGDNPNKNQDFRILAMVDGLQDLLWPYSCYPVIILI